MPEKFCPLCGKPLIKGECVDCGYKTDDTVLANEQPNYYTGDSTNYAGNNSVPQNAQPVQPMYQQNNMNNQGIPQQGNGNQQQFNNAPQQDAALKNEKAIKILAITMSFVFPFAGLILSLQLRRSPNPKTRSTGTAFMIVSIVMMVLLTILTI